MGRLDAGISASSKQSALEADTTSIPSVHIALLRPDLRAEGDPEENNTIHCFWTPRTQPQAELLITESLQVNLPLGVVPLLTQQWAQSIFSWIPWREARTWPFFLATVVWSHEFSEVARDFHQQRRDRIPPAKPEMGRTLTSPVLGCLTVSGVLLLMELSNKMSAFSEKRKYNENMFSFQMLCFGVCF